MKRVCMDCGEPYDGALTIVLYAHCDQCGEKQIHGTKAEYNDRY
jgi:DNA-directed RNA polymerase subunit RPC12/RpoP